MEYNKENQKISINYYKVNTFLSENLTYDYLRHLL